MATRYTPEFLKLSYKIEHRSHLDPTEDELREWDEEIAARYDGFLAGEMAEAGIEDSRRNRSLLVTMALCATGTGRTKVERAASYWAHVGEMELG